MRKFYILLVIVIFVPHEAISHGEKIHQKFVQEAWNLLKIQYNLTDSDLLDFANHVGPKNDGKNINYCYYCESICAGAWDENSYYSTTQNKAEV